MLLIFFNRLLLSCTGDSLKLLRISVNALAWLTFVLANLSVRVLPADLALSSLIKAGFCLAHSCHKGR